MVSLICYCMFVIADIVDPVIAYGLTYMFLYVCDCKCCWSCHCIWLRSSLSSCDSDYFHSNKIVNNALVNMSFLHIGMGFVLFSLKLYYYMLCCVYFYWSVCLFFFNHSIVSLVSIYKFECPCSFSSLKLSKLISITTQSCTFMHILSDLIKIVMPLLNWL